MAKHLAEDVFVQVTVDHVIHAPDIGSFSHMESVWIVLTLINLWLQVRHGFLHHPLSRVTCALSRLDSYILTQP